MEEQLREQAALVRLGEMAAVIAHEVKNPLAGIRGAVQVIGGRLEQGSREAGVVGEILSRIDTLNRLIQDLLLFARPPQPKPAPVEVVPIVMMTAELLGADPAWSGVRIDVEGSAPPLAADAELLKIVFLNLFVNSAQAMRGEGSIQVSIGVANERCRIAVADAGPGIAPDIREKIFTPFFTTKSRGTGLGLATAKRLVEAHHGTIAIDCPHAGGTIVTVHLPLAAAPVAAH
jgi:signal transduction histidine kinase